MFRQKGITAGSSPFLFFCNSGACFGVFVVTVVFKDLDMVAVGAGVDIALFVVISECAVDDIVDIERSVLVVEDNFSGIAAFAVADGSVDERDLSVRVGIAVDVGGDVVDSCFVVCDDVVGDDDGGDDVVSAVVVVAIGGGGDNVAVDGGFGGGDDVVVASCFGGDDDVVAAVEGCSGGDDGVAICDGDDGIAVGVVGVGDGVTGCGVFCVREVVLVGGVFSDTRSVVRVVEVVDNFSIFKTSTSMKTNCILLFFICESISIYRQSLY